VDDSNYWRLKGPAGWIRLIADDLRKGGNSVIILPEHTPSGWRDTLRETIGGEAPIVLLPPDRGEWTPFQALRSLTPAPADCQYDLTEFLRKAANPAPPYVFVTGVTVANVKNWQPFLTEYTARKVEGRYKKLPPLLLEASPDSFKPDSSGVTERRYDGVAAYNDMINYVSDLIEATPQRGMSPDLRVETIVQLALWDPEAARLLARSSPETVLNPYDLLRQLAVERGWEAIASTEGYGALWGAGVQNRFNHATPLHSSYLCLTGQEEDVGARIWLAQMIRLFPEIESARRRMIKKYRNRITLPFSYTYQGQETVIRDYADIEFAHLLHILGGAVSSDDYRQMQMYRDMRNKLAHFKRLEAGEMGVWSS